MASDDYQFARAPRYDEVLDEIGLFAARYFSIPVIERVAAWHRLHARAREFPILADRLQGLMAGLTIEPASLTCDGEAREIVEAILCAYVLPAPEQAELCRQQLAAFAEPRYQLAADRVHQRYPQVSTLTPLVASIPSFKEPRPQEDSPRALIADMMFEPLLTLGVGAVFAVCFLLFGGNKKGPDPNAGRKQTQELVKDLNRNRKAERGMEILRTAQEEKALFKLLPNRAQDARTLVDQLVSRQAAEPDPELAAILELRTAQMKNEGRDEDEIAWMQRAEVIRFELHKRQEQVAPPVGPR